MKKLLILFFCLIAILSYGQNQSGNKKVRAGFGVSVVQKEPEFPGGADSLQNFLNRSIEYPANARLNNIHGRVYVGFMIDRKGIVKEIRLLSGVNDELDKEAVRVAKLLPSWKPGTAGGSPVDVHYILPIDFIIPAIK